MKRPSLNLKLLLYGVRQLSFSKPERSESRGKANEKHMASAVARRSHTRTQIRSCRSAPSTRTSCAWCRATRTSTRRATSCSCTSTGRASQRSCSTRRLKPGQTTRPTRATRTYVQMRASRTRCASSPPLLTPAPPLPRVLCAQTPIGVIYCYARHAFF